MNQLLDWLLGGNKANAPVEVGVPDWTSDDPMGTSGQTKSKNKAYQAKIAKQEQAQAAINALKARAESQGNPNMVTGGSGGSPGIGSLPQIVTPGNNWGTALAQGAQGYMAGQRQRGLDAERSADEIAMQDENDAIMEQLYGVPKQTPMSLPNAVGVQTGAAPTSAPTGVPLSPMQGESVAAVSAPQTPGATPTSGPGPQDLNPALLADAQAQREVEQQQQLEMDAQANAAQAAQVQPATNPIPGSLDAPQQAPEAAGMDPMAERNRQMMAAYQLTKNPLGRTLGMEMFKSGVDWPEKQALQQDKLEAQSADRLRSMEMQAQRLEQMSQDKSLDRAQRERLAEMRLSLQAAMANESNKIRKQGYELQASMLPLRVQQLQQNVDEKARGKPLTDKDKEIMSADTGTISALNSLADTFNDNYAGYGALGPAARTAVGLAGSWAPGEYQDMANWWSTFEKLSVLPERNKMFGSALTAAETAAWNNAQKVAASKDPDSVRAALQEMIAIANRHQTQYVNALTAEGKNSESINALSSQGGEKRVVETYYSPSTGKTKYVYSDGSEEIR